MTPDDRRYTAQHQWIKCGDGPSCRVGITDFAQEQLGEVTLVELPEVGEHFDTGEPYGFIESHKSVSELHSPVTGKVTAINESLVERPGTVNDSPYEEGWIVEVEPDDLSELLSLLEAGEYERRFG